LVFDLRQREVEFDCGVVEANAAAAELFESVALR
jgi:hypothetical protein